MDKNDIIEYVMNTPHNTNKAVLSSMLNQLTEGGGGGSSDFSTATVTIVNNSGMPAAFVSPLIEEREGEEFFATSSTISNGEHTLVIVLYKGTSADGISIDAVSDNITVTGNATYEEHYLIITGDCTITIS